MLAKYEFDIKKKKNIHSQKLLCIQINNYNNINT